MLSDIKNSPRDVRFAPRGTGLAGADVFICASCNSKKLTRGRRRLFVRGCKSWVCAACVEAKGAK